MKFHSVPFIAVVALVAVPWQACASDDLRATLPNYADSIKPFFQKHCFRCHASDDAEGEMRLDQLPSVITDAQTAETWQEVLDVLNAGEMPPENERQPSREELADVIGALTDGLFETRKRLADKREVTIRRLNRREYANTIHDLLGVPIDTQDLPDDGTVDGFDTIGDAHFMSVAQFDAYLEIGRQALDRALVDGPIPERSISRIEPEQERNAKARASIQASVKEIPEIDERLRGHALSDNDRKNVEKRRASVQENLRRGEAYLAQPASKTGFILDLTQKPFGGQRHDKAWVELPRDGRSVDDLKGQPEAAVGRPIGRYVARFQVGLTCHPEPGNRLYVEFVRTDAFTQQVTYIYPLGTFKVSRTMDDPHVFEVPFENLGETGDLIAVKVSGLNDVPRGRASVVPDSTRIAYVCLDWLEVEGPFLEQWPPAAWTETFFKGVPDNLADKSEYAREIIERFAFRAFRHREPDVEYVDRLHGIYTRHREEGMPFVEAVKESLAIVLASPSFVYLVEQPSADGESRRRLSDLELASRLSYFFWSHPPDEELYLLAEQGRLSSPAVLHQQVERMLNDPKVMTFVEAFTSQWLELPWLDMIVVDRGRYPEFNETLRSSFREETVQFVNHLIQRDLSVTNLIDSDFVVIDDVLASFYGVEIGSGSGFRKVLLPEESPRGGLLGQGSVLTMTGTGDRTSPVERGVFVYSRLLGRPVPPPPPNVPQLEIDGEQELTVRETLNAHIEKAQCASCHRRMDPLGFGLEHFNAIGQWRDRELPLGTSFRGARNRQPADGLEIDATGVMPDGRRRFDGHEQLKSLIMQDSDGLANGVARSMLTYALGRRVGFADGEFVERLQADWKQSGYGMRTLIHAIVQSDEFQTK